MSQRTVRSSGWKSHIDATGAIHPPLPAQRLSWRTLLTLVDRSECPRPPLYEPRRLGHPLLTVTHHHLAPTSPDRSTTLPQRSRPHQTRNVRCNQPLHCRNLFRTGSRRPPHRHAPCYSRCSLWNCTPTRSQKFPINRQLMHRPECWKLQKCGGKRTVRQRAALAPAQAELPPVMPLVTVFCTEALLAKC